MPLECKNGTKRECKGRYHNQIRKIYLCSIERENMKYLLLVIVLIIVTITAGCVSENRINLTPTQTTPISTIIVTSVPTTIATTIPTPTALRPSDNQINKTDNPEPIPTAEINLSNITFSRYSDTDFSLNYPSSWEIKKTTTEFSNNQINGRDVIKQPGRKIEFVGKDNKTRLEATTYDFISPGAFVISRDFNWARDSVTAQFPDVNGATAVINNNFFKDDRNNMVATFDVILPKSSVSYPYSYSEKAIVTFRHDYSFKLIAERGNIGEYKNLKEAIFTSIVTNDATTGV
jgi:hypothetical protein